jgi:hypothetical protein
MGLRAKSSTSTWRFLNRSSASDVALVREVLEEWFARYPAHAQREFAARFRAENNGDTRAAFFELFLHELCRRLGCTLELHPELPGTENRPDFRVIPPYGSAFYLEAAVAYEESAAERAAKSRKNEAFDALNNLRDTRVFLTVSYEGTPGTPPPIAQFRKQIETELARLTDEDLPAADSNGGPDQSVAQWRFEHDGWVVEVEAFPRSPSQTGDVDVRPIAVTLGDVRFVDTSGAIRRAVMKKATRYGELDLPFVVAVNSGGGFGVDYDDVTQALFGDDAMAYSMSAAGLVTESARPVRQPNGAWWGPDGSRNTRVSACLMTSRCAAWSIPRASAALYHNPWGGRRYDSVLCRLTQYVPENRNLDRVDGLSVGELFGLPPDWPGERE